MSATRFFTLGPFSGRYSPDYDLRFWHDGDPRKRIRNVNLRSATAIQTSKSLDDFSGTFTITLKDRQARHLIKEMDTAVIRLQGHDGHGMRVVMRGVVDTVRQGGSADTYASREDTVIEGRDIGKYLQITSLFLPVWDPQGVLPTALIFGLGDAAKKVGGNTPFDIFNYLVKRYTWGTRRLAGVSGVPNSRFWLDHTTRFNKVPFEIPFMQFDEDAMSDALKRFEVLGYTEAWVDEVGRVVYRHPPWDQPAKYRIPTSSLSQWDFPRTDVGAATYFEVIPAGDPGIDSATAQALRAGRAPVPSSYLSGKESSQFNVSKEFVIDTDSSGKVTAKGAKNFWYQRQRSLGLRPQQITSPLLFTQAQAQAEAEGLLQFYGRMVKTMQATLPGCPIVRLGENARVFGPLDGLKIDRTYYIDQVAHEYVEGQDGGSYTTSLHGSHGRDPWDPKWGTIAIPKFDPADLAAQGGVLSSGGGGVSSVNGYVNPFSRVHNLGPSRVDMGVDYTGSGPVLAIGRCRVFNVKGAGWPGGVFIGYTLLDGPYAGKHVYFAEHMLSSVSVGDHLQAGDVIGHMYPPSIECGWAAGGGDGALAAALGQQASPDPGGWMSAAGYSFNKLLEALGVPSGTKRGSVHGHMPAGYP